MKFYDDYKKEAMRLADGYGIPVNTSRGDLLSFTPYIENSCSAACRFCSERLTKNGMDSSCGSVCPDYQKRLAGVLMRLRDKRIFLSLSGKEPTESPEQLELISSAVNAARQSGLVLSEAVMYSNLSGFCKWGDRILEAVSALPLTRIEFSRHHFDEEINQRIMRFRSGERIRYNETLSAVVKQLGERYPERMVCVLQKAGIGDVEGVMRYLEFARSLGVNDVVFRELALFGDSVDPGSTAGYITGNRVEINDIMHRLPESFRLVNITEGYYYFSFVYELSGMRVCFEMSDYEEMEKKHSGSRIHKLIFYPDGKLCRSWNKKGVVDDAEGSIF